MKRICLRRRLTALLTAILCWLAVQAQTNLFFGTDRLLSTNITCLCQDQEGYIWIGTECGLNRFDGYRFTAYQSDQQDSTSLGYNKVASLLCDREGRLWVGTNRGLQCYDYATNSFINYYFPDYKEARISSIIQLLDGRLLFGTSGRGVYTLDVEGNILERLLDLQGGDEGDLFFNRFFEAPDGKLWKCGNNRFGFLRNGEKANLFRSSYGNVTSFFSLNGTTVAVCRDQLLVYDGHQMVPSDIDLSAAGGCPHFRSALKDRKGNVYIGTFGHGLYWIPAGTKRLVRHPAMVQGYDLNTSKISAMMEDRQGNIWIGSQQKGLVMLSNQKAPFTSWRFSHQKIDIGTFVTSVCEGDGGMIWCAVQKGGVYGFDSNGRVVAHPEAPAEVEKIYRDKSGHYWLCTVHGVYAYDPLTGKSQQLTDFPCDCYYTMLDDGERLYLSAFGRGMLVYNRSSQSFTRYSMTLPKDPDKGKLGNDWVITMLADHEGRIWIGTSDGVCCYDPRTSSFKPFGWMKICKKLINTLLETKEGNILIGTEQGCFLWRRATNELEEHPDLEPLNNLAIGNIVMDHEGDYWFSTSMGIWHYFVQEKKWVNYVYGLGLHTREYVNGASLHTADDRIFFATNDGLTSFTPHQVNNVLMKPGTLCLTGFYIGQQPVSMLTKSDGRQVTDRPVAESERFTVGHMDNNLALEFSLFNYDNAANIIFEHRLNEGTWIAEEIGVNRIVLSHLPCGTYQLEVRALDNGNYSEPKTITIVVMTPWYATIWAYLVYVVCFLLFVTIFVWLWRRHVKDKKDKDEIRSLFDTTYENLQTARQLLQRKSLGMQKAASQIEEIRLKGNDELLFERIMKSINDNIGNSNYGVEILCKEVGISRANLHRKMKDMTGMATSEFIRNIRMEQAARLLSEGKLNITQVAYAVGSESLPYFSTMFKKHFGITPTEYVEQQKNEA